MARKAKFVVNITTTPETVSGAEDGTATVVIVEGVGPYRYAWSTGATTQSVTGLAPGYYSVNVTNFLRRTITINFYIAAGEVLPSLYVFLNDSAAASTAQLGALYDEADTEAADIEGVAGAGTPGILPVTITYGNDDDFLEEEIFVDTTTASTFWNDVNGWLQMNNFYDITSFSGKYLVNDPSNSTYIKLSI